MVSLSDNSRRAGGFCFTDDQPLIQARETDSATEQEDIILTAHPDPPYRQLKTVPFLIVLQALLFIAMLVVSFVLPVLFTWEVRHLDAFTLVILCHCGLWLILVLLDRLLSRLHNESRLLGYLRFYRQTRFTRSWAVFVNSAGNAALLITVILLEAFCPTEHSNCASSFKRDYYPQIIVALELVAVIPVLVLYLVRTVRFNKQRALPDVVQSDILQSFQSGFQRDVGYQDEAYEERLAERQSDLIRYLVDHSQLLCQRVLTLTAELDQYKQQGMTV